MKEAEAGTEPSVLISARTEDGRAVSFRHDEIRDWYGNIRLDHGYALTITSAQGLTVDRTFLLADARPSRETIYPAATRHRERLDIYVNRGAARSRYRRQAGRQRPGSGGDGHRDPGVSRRALVALATEGGRARLHGGWYMARPRRKMSGRTEVDPPAKPRTRPTRMSVRRRTTTTTRWPASRGMYGAPPSAGVMPRR